MISKAATVDEFLKTVTGEERAVFTMLRKLLRAEPKVKESMDYRLPTYKIGENMAGAFNKQKNYLCFYANPAAVDPYRTELSHLDCGKSCIRFKKPEELPLDVAAKIIKAAARLAAQ